MNREIQGIIAAMVTPMDKTEAVNLSELRCQTERLITAGLHGLFCLGTNGEAYVLEEKEKLEIIRCVVEQANGRLPVLARNRLCQHYSFHCVGKGSGEIGGRRPFGHQPMVCRRFSGRTLPAFYDSGGFCTDPGLSL